jgi:hypothetical protein
MNAVRLRVTSLHVPAGHAISEYWRHHHHSLLDTQFTRSRLVGNLVWRESCALIEAQLPADQSTSESDLLALANTAIVGAQYAAFQIAEGTIMTAIAGWPAGGAVGLLTGSQVAKNSPPLVRLAATLLIGAVGAAVSSRLKAEIPIYKLVAQTDGRLAWQRVPFWTAVPSNFAVA